jgi:outer membrane protein assembly factor BamB
MMREMRCFWFIAALFMVANFAFAQREFRSASRFEPPVENFRANISLETIADLLERKDFNQAAAQVESLLKSNADEITSGDERSLISISNWIDSLSRLHGKELTAAYRERFDAGAKGALDELRRDSTATPERFYILARRFRFSSIAVDAYVEAADRAIGLGDAQAASTYFNLAIGLGYKPDDDHAGTIGIARALVGEPLGDLPPAAQKTASNLAAKMSRYRGPIAFDAIWYMRSDAVGMSKTIPAGEEGAIYLVAPRQVFAMKENGQSLWNFAAPEAWARGLAPDRANDKGRGTIYSPAIFSSPVGPQILVVRQPLGAGRDYGIRALRASDGKLLWSTDLITNLDTLSFAGNPAIAGRFVYATAVEFTEQSGQLLLVALDLMDGHLIFKTPLGTLLQMRRARDDPRGWDEFWEQTEPAIAGDLVIVAPNVGLAAAVGRFDGHIRWTRTYEEKMVVIGRGRERLFGDGDRLPIPTDQNELLRYRGTPEICGSIAVVAPQDTAATFGINLTSGAMVWKLDSPPAPTLIGHQGNIAVFAGDSVEGIDAGQWQGSLALHSDCTGPHYWAACAGQ